MIIRGQFIKRHKWWFGPPHQGRFDIFNDDGQRVQLDPSYQRHITFACKGCYQLQPHHRLGIITPTYHRYQFTDPERMDSLVSLGRLYVHNLCPRLLHN